MELNFRPLTADDVEVRVGQVSENRITLLLYKDARCDMKILDETVGAENWECHYEAIKNNLFCTVKIFGISKQDVGIPSNMESEKGEASDAFKRACFKWGIGRELYTAPEIVLFDGFTVTQGKNGKPACYDRFKVTDMQVENGRITSLVVINVKTGEQVFPKNVPSKPKTTPKNASQTPKQRFWKACQDTARKEGAENITEAAKAISEQMLFELNATPTDDDFNTMAAVLEVAL